MLVLKHPVFLYFFQYLSVTKIPQCPRDAFNTFFLLFYILFLAIFNYNVGHTPQITVQRCQIAALRWSNDISSAADNAIFKNRTQNIECSFGCVAHSIVLLNANVNDILLFNFCEQKFVQHGPITIAIGCNGLSLLIFKQKWSNYSSRPKSELNSESFWVCRLFNVCVRVFATILLVYIPAKIKMIFI